VAATTAGGHQQQHGREVAPAGQPPGSGEVATTTTTVGRHNPTRGHHLVGDRRCLYRTRENMIEKQDTHREREREPPV
jgi:hypothetical protein